MSNQKKKIREAFRKAVFKRDDNKCKICGISGAVCALDAHHIIPREVMPNGGYVKENGITLCDQPEGCHEKAEAHLAHKDIETIYGFENLYKLIGSDIKRAWNKSLELEKS